MKTLKYFLLTVACCAPAFMSADVATPEMTHRRSSLCQILISRQDQDMADKIVDKYLEIPTPEQYNDHNLSIRVLNVTSKKKEMKDSIDMWLDNNRIASRLVGKWFNRDILTGECDMNLVKQRGLYNATELDKALAARSQRGMAMLEDAGEDLIGNTFVLVHQAHYIDNAKRSKNVATGMRIGGALLGAFFGSGISDLIDNLADMAETFKGFRVKFHTQLYQLDWNDEVASQFYKQMYASTPDDAKGKFFEEHRDLFRLKYLGDVESSGSKNSFLGISEEHPEVMIRKACQRAIDDNVRDLQAAHEVFRVKSPISEIQGKEIKVAIGRKEGITKDSEYEVLEPIEENGKISYKRVGVLSPMEYRIWDNRYMAREEGAIGSELSATTFKLKSGKCDNPGYLVRQIK